MFISSPPIPVSVTTQQATSLGRVNREGKKSAWTVKFSSRASFHLIPREEHDTDMPFAVGLASIKHRLGRSKQAPQQSGNRHLPRF